MTLVEIIERDWRNVMYFVHCQDCVLLGLASHWPHKDEDLVPIGLDATPSGA